MYERGGARAAAARAATPAHGHAIGCYQGGRCCCTLNDDIVAGRI